MNALKPDQVADYLLEHPQFLAQHPQVLSALDLPRQVGANTVSLHAHQAQLLREQNAQLNAQLLNFIESAKASEVIVRQLHMLSRALLAQRTAMFLPDAVIDSVAHVFGLQQVALRLWNVLPPYRNLPCAQAVDPQAHTFAQGLVRPYCGPNAGFTAVQWLPDLEQAPIKSLALIALRLTPQSPAYGLAVLGSTDSQRFTREHDTSLLELIGQVLSAALGRLIED